MCSLCSLCSPLGLVASAGTFGEVVEMTGIVTESSLSSTIEILRQEAGTDIIIPVDIAVTQASTSYFRALAFLISEDPSTEGVMDVVTCERSRDRCSLIRDRMGRQAVPDTEKASETDDHDLSRPLI